MFSYTVPKKEATEFTKELVNKVENSTLKVAVEKALLFLEKNELPPHWDRDSLFGHSVSSGNSDSDGDLESDVRFLREFQLSIIPQCNKFHFSEFRR